MSGVLAGEARAWVLGVRERRRSKFQSLDSLPTIPCRILVDALSCVPSSWLGTGDDGRTVDMSEPRCMG
jgi:hypothetical protein